jgi:hypothetical protein
METDDETPFEHMTQAIFAAVALASAEVLDEYAHLTAKGIDELHASPQEMLASVMKACKDEGYSVDDAYAKAVPVAFLHTAVMMLVEGLGEDAFHVTHEIMFRILDLSPVETKRFWQMHKEDQEAKDDE